MASSTVERRPLNPILRELLIGVYDESSPLHKLIGLKHAVKMVWLQVKREWMRCIQTFSPKPEYHMIPALSSNTFDEGGFCRLGRIFFPPYAGININMMPFILGVPFKHSRLPKYLKAYYDKLVTQCQLNMIEAEEKGKIGFLTVHESLVEANESQRRSGIHTDKSRKLILSPDGGNFGEDCSFGGNSYALTRTRKLRTYTHWGMGNMRAKCMEIHGGIYIATNIGNSSKVWNCKINDHPVDRDEIIGDLGDLSHLRELLPDGESLYPNTLYWITDRTPHESLPLTESAERQFFRLVTSQVSVWYEEHSTPNPTGLMPNPAVTKIVKGNKFEKPKSSIRSAVTKIFKGSKYEKPRTTKN